MRCQKNDLMKTVDRVSLLDMILGLVELSEDVRSGADERIWAICFIRRELHRQH